jgi:hypothetical protein
MRRPPPLPRDALHRIVELNQALRRERTRHACCLAKGMRCVQRHDLTPYDFQVRRECANLELISRSAAINRWLKKRKCIVRAQNPAAPERLQEPALSREKTLPAYRCKRGPCLRLGRGLTSHDKHRLRPCRLSSIWSQREVTCSDFYHSHKIQYYSTPSAPANPRRFFWHNEISANSARARRERACDAGLEPRSRTNNVWARAKHGRRRGATRKKKKSGRPRREADKQTATILSGAGTHRRRRGRGARARGRMFVSGRSASSRRENSYTGAKRNRLTRYDDDKAKKHWMR